MIYSAKLLHAPVPEYTLGAIARFTHGVDFEESNKMDSKNYNVVKTCFKFHHDSVFEFATLLYKIECPIAIARHLMRHRNGVFMERSLRVLKPALIDNYDYQENDRIYEESYNRSVDLYNSFVKIGEKRERARFVLTLATPTQFLWQLDLRSLINVFDQRLKKNAQHETRRVVKDMFTEAKCIYPHILNEWLKNNPEADVSEEL